MTPRSSKESDSTDCMYCSLIAGSNLPSMETVETVSDGMTAAKTEKRLTPCKKARGMKIHDPETQTMSISGCQVLMALVSAPTISR